MWLKNEASLHAYSTGAPIVSDRTLERTNPDWSLYVADFDDRVSTRLHVRPTARLKVEQQKSERQGDLVWIAFGPHAQLFLPRAIASRLRELLDALFSAGASDGTSTSSVSVDGHLSDTSTAPAERPQPTRSDPGITEKKPRRP